MQEQFSVVALGRRPLDHCLELFGISQGDVVW